MRRGRSDEDTMMNSRWNEFFKEERKRVFEPGPYFYQRVMARLKEQRTRENLLWEIIQSATRPVVALALTLLLALLGIQMFLPTEPSRGMIEAYLDPEVTAVESLLYTEVDGAPTHEVLEQLMVLEADQ